MKKKDRITKSLKRSKKKADKGIIDLMMIMHHFFKEFPSWINEMTDPRHPSYIVYSQADLVYMGLLKNMCGVKTMHSMEEQFNENESKNISKQDCEIAASKRLLKHLAEEYPRMPICIQGDALYAAESIMKICRRKHWSYIFTHKATRQKCLDESYEWIK